MNDIDHVRAMLDKFDSRIRELGIRNSEAAFAMYRGLEHDDLNEIEAEEAKLWREDETLELAESDAAGTELERPLFLVNRGILANKVEGIEEIFRAKNEAQKILVEFKLKVDDEEISRTDIGELMRWEKDAGKRKRADEAWIPLEDTIHDKVLSLIELRNNAARDLGFESFAHLAFELNELDLIEVKTQLEELLANGKESFLATLDEYRDKPEMSEGALLSSDLAYMHENYLPNLPKDKFPADRLIDTLVAEYGTVGIDIENLPIQTVIQDIPAGGFCFTFDPGKDARILANPRDGQMWYQILFHEYGHAVQGVSAKGDGHFLVALSDPGFFWEGIAVLFEHLAKRRSFLTKFVTDDEYDTFLEGVRKRLAYRIRRLSLAALFEYSIYLDPAPYGELRQRKADMFREHLGVEPSVDPPVFTPDIFHITHPCYIQNYVLAEMIAAQLLEASESTNGEPWDEKFTSRVITELLVPGGMIAWRDKIMNFTGKPLGPDALLRVLNP